METYVKCSNCGKVVYFSATIDKYNDMTILVDLCEKCTDEMKQKVEEKITEEFKDSKEYKQEIDLIYKLAYDAGYEIGLRAGKKEPVIVIQGEE